VRWYLRFKLGLRDLVEMMAERGLSMAHTTIMRWVQRYVPEFEKRWRRFARSPTSASAARQRSRSDRAICTRAAKIT
jgi:transposase-like protein